MWDINQIIAQNREENPAPVPRLEAEVSERMIVQLFYNGGRTLALCEDNSVWALDVDNYGKDVWRRVHLPRIPNE